MVLPHEVVFHEEHPVSVVGEVHRVDVARKWRHGLSVDDTRDVVFRVERVALREGLDALTVAAVTRVRVVLEYLQKMKKTRTKETCGFIP